MKKKYVITSIIILVILSIIYILKGYFPFGNESIIWSDMHEQITAMYYHFYDSVYNSSSLLVDFNSGGTISFIGVLAYYILSPFTLIILLFPRDLIDNAVSIIVALKILMSGLTCLYFLSKTFNKLNVNYQIILALLYAFSSYSLTLYIITPWMDIVYLFPLILLGLKELLDLKSTKLYIITLSVSLICSFYITFMVLLFIIFSSLIYLLIYNKKNIKKAIFHLGMSTFISLLIASIILLPTLIQIFNSARASINLNTIINSQFGPLSDKIAYLFGSTILLAFILLVLLNYKKHKKFSLFILLNLLILCLPLIIEPINKMWHFGSYVFFCYRYGFITIFMLVIGSAYYLSNMNISKKYSIFISRIIPILLMITIYIVMFLIIYKYRFRIFKAIDHLTLTRDKTALLVLFLVALLIFIVSFILFLTNKKENKFTIIFLYVIAISQILFNSYFYFNKYDSNYLDNQYKLMKELNKVKLLKDKYYVKETNRILVSNYGMVSNVRTFTNFTSLVKKVNYDAMLKLGYDSYGNDTESIGGNLFLDIVLGQKYIVSDKEFNDSYYNYIDNINNYLYYYEFNKDISFGYIIKENNSIAETNNSFEASNIIYNSITSDENIFDVIDLVELENDFFVTGRKRVYLDIDFDISDKVNNYNLYNIYVNGNLVYESVPNTHRNGSLFLGEYFDEDISIKIVSLKENNINNISLGILDLQKFDDFLNSNYVNTNVTFVNNKINIEVDGNENDILYLPITYLDGYKCDSHDIFRVFDNYIGIKLHDGKNIIEISFIPNGLLLGLIFTIVGLIIFVIWEKYLYQLDINILNNIFYYIYLIIYFILILLFYLLLPILFIISFI